jgi:hypothetical protein
MLLVAAASTETVTAPHAAWRSCAFQAMKHSTSIVRQGNPEDSV